MFRICLPAHWGCELDSAVVKVTWIFVLLFRSYCVEFFVLGFIGMSSCDVMSKVRTGKSMRCRSLPALTDLAHVCRIPRHHHHTGLGDTEGSTINIQTRTGNLSPSPEPSPN